MKSIERVQIGKTPLKVTRLGFGCATLGGLYRDLSDEAAAATVHRALGLGLNFFDTAPLYGAGKSESRLGGVLSMCERTSFVLASKVGFALVPINPEATEDIFFPFENAPPLRPAPDYTYDGTMRSFEGSLKRLNIERIDILHIHEPVGFYDEAINGVLKALRKLKQEGLITAIGAAMNEAEMLVRFAQEADFDCFLLAGRYTLLEQGALTDLLPLCAKRKISIIIGGPYNSGILATGAKPDSKYNYLDAPAEILETVRQIEAVCKSYSVPLKAAALQFPLAHTAVASVIPGCASISEVEENMRMVDYSIPSEFWREMQRKKLLPHEAPIPGHGN